MGNDQRIYFAALIPNEVIQEEITAFKEYAAEHFNSKRALTSPPHITIQPPFKWNKHNLHPIQEVLSAVCEQQEVFEVNLKDFSSFPPRVIFIDVEKTDALINFHYSVQTEMKKQFNLVDRHPGFNPHMTVAFKDLKKTMFPVAWKYFAKIHYCRTFIVDQLALLEHNGKFWEILESFDLKTE